MQIHHLAEALSESGVTGFARLSRGGSLDRASLDAVAAALSDPEDQELAYEKAVRVCAADGRMADLERPFVDDLAQALILDTQPVVGPGVADLGYLNIYQ